MATSPPSESGAAPAHEPRLGHDVAWRGVQTAVRQGLGLYVLVLGAVFLPPEGLGRYAFALSVVSLLTVFADFGISAAAATGVAQWRATDPRRVPGVITGTVLGTASAAVLVCIAFLMVREPLLGSEVSLAMYVAPIALLAPLAAVYDGAFRGMRRFRSLGAATVVTGLVVLPVGYLLVRAYGTRGALLTQAVLQCVLVLGLAAAWRPYSARVDWSGVRQVLRYGAWIGLANAGYYLYTRVDVYLLGQFGYLAEVAPYELVTRAVMLASLPFAVFGQALAPRVASRVATDGAATVLPDIRRHVLVSVGLGFVLAAALYLGFPPLIRAALPDYASPALLISVVLLALLLPSRCWDALLCQGYIVPAGMARILTVTTLAGGLVNVLGDWVALRWFGYAGVIWTTLLVHTAVIWLNHAWFVRACRRARTA